jgi:hypothetical protein
MKDRLLGVSKQTIGAAKRVVGDAGLQLDGKGRAV